MINLKKIETPKSSFDFTPNKKPTKSNKHRQQVQRKHFGTLEEQINNIKTSGNARTPAVPGAATLPCSQSLQLPLKKSTKRASPSSTKMNYEGQKLSQMDNYDSDTGSPNKRNKNFEDESTDETEDQVPNYLTRPPREIFSRQHNSYSENSNVSEQIENNLPEMFSKNSGNQHQGVISGLKHQTASARLTINSPNVQRTFSKSSEQEKSFTQPNRPTTPVMQKREFNRQREALNLALAQKPQVRLRNRNRESYNQMSRQQEQLYKHKSHIIQVGLPNVPIAPPEGYIQHSLEQPEAQLISQERYYGKNYQTMYGARSSSNSSYDNATYHQTHGQHQNLPENAYETISMSSNNSQNNSQNYPATHKPRKLVTRQNSKPRQRPVNILRRKPNDPLPSTRQEDLESQFYYDQQMDIKMRDSQENLQETTTTHICDVNLDAQIFDRNFSGNSLNVENLHRQSSYQNGNIVSNSHGTYVDNYMSRNNNVPNERIDPRRKLTTPVRPVKVPSFNTPKSQRMLSRMDSNEMTGYYMNIDSKSGERSHMRRVCRRNSSATSSERGQTCASLLG